MGVEDEGSHFVHRLRYRPWRLRRVQYDESAIASGANIRLPPPAQRSARFIVGLDDMAATIVPEDICNSAPLDAVMYLGRAEDVDENGNVTARLWECAGGQEYIATLTRETLAGQHVRPGASLRVFTWYELPNDAVLSDPDPAPEERIYVDVRHRTLSADERAELKALADELAKESAET